MRAVLEAVAVGASGIFAGAALYVSLVEHPARMSAGIEVARREFPPSYARATRLQVAMALLSAIAAAALWWTTGRGAWLAGGVLQFAVIPFTLAAMLPTNRRLLDAASPPDDAEARTLLQRWGRLHAVRTVLGLAAFVVLLIAALGSRGWTQFLVSRF